MMIRTKDMEKYRIEATNGTVGKMRNLFFDERDWSVRYLVVHTGPWLRGKEVLISPQAVRKLDVEKGAIMTNLTTEKLRNSPLIDAYMPLHRQMEMKLFQHMGWTPYWDYSPPGTGTAGNVPPDPSTGDTVDILEGQDPCLRDTWKVRGYTVLGRNEEAGRVDDFILDPEKWAFGFMTLTIGKWRIGAPKRVVPVDRISVVDWNSGTVSLDLAFSRILDGPPQDPSVPFSEEAARLVSEYFEKPE